MARACNRADFCCLLTGTILVVPYLVQAAICLMQTPNERRTKNLILALVLERLSLGIALIGAAIIVWIVPWGDLPFFIRVEGRHWLAFWIASPLWIVALCRLALAWKGRRTKLSDADRHVVLTSRLRQLTLATIALLALLGYRELAPRLLDADLVNLTRLLMTLAFLGIFSQFIPERCLGCSHRTLLRLPNRPPFTTHGDHRKLSRCLSCGEQFQEPKSSLDAGSEPKTLLSLQHLNDRSRPAGPENS
jgi:hypothetical protein